LIVSGSADGTATIWRVSDGALLSTFPADREVASLALTSNDEILAIGLDPFRDSNIAFWRISDHALLGQIADARPGTLALSPDGTLVAAASVAYSAKL